MVSIIMAVKDTDPYLADCLDSILNQSYSDWELIAVNDNSSDNSLNILQAYAENDARIKVYSNPESGLLSALRHGYGKSSGELITRMDSDDKMPVYKIDEQVKAWNKYGKGTVISGSTKHFSDEFEIGDGFKKYDTWLDEVSRDNLHMEYLYKECVIPSSCWIIHREDFDRAAAFNSDVFPEDYDLCFRMVRAGVQIQGIDMVLHNWRDREDRISRNWEVYKDNRYFDLKMRFFYELHRDMNRPIVLWGAGRNGKDLAKLLLEREKSFHWVCDNENKIGKDVYGIQMQHFDEAKEVPNSQLLIVVASPDGKQEIREILNNWGKIEARDYWFWV